MTEKYHKEPWTRSDRQKVSAAKTQAAKERCMSQHGDLLKPKRKQQEQVK